MSLLIANWRDGRQRNRRDDMNSERKEIELTDGELNEVNGGFLWFLAGVVMEAGAVLAGYGAVRLVQDIAARQK